MISSTDLNPAWCPFKLILTIHLKGFQIDHDEMVLSSNQNQNPVLKDQSGIKLMVSIWKPNYYIQFKYQFGVFKTTTVRSKFYEFLFDA